MKYDLELITLAQTICREIREAGATGVMVAGGFPSNMLLEHPINDIDVFYEGELKSCPYKPEIKQPVKANSWFPFPDAEQNFQLGIFDDSLLGYPPNEEWQVTHNKVFKDGVKYPIQLIKVKEIETYLDTFGAGIRKVAITEYGLFFAAEFIKNVELQTISFSVDQNTRFAQKIKQQFPDYSYT